MISSAQTRVLTAALMLAGVSWARANTFVRMDYNLNLMTTAQNTVFIELFDDRPLTRDNFLQYVDAGRYDDSIMHRLAQGFVLQGGGFYESYTTEPSPINFALNPNSRVDLDGNPATSNPTVNNEFGNSPARSNVRGTLAMAKVGGNPNSATNQYFFNLANNGGNLDNQNGGFTVFAQVVGNGMTLVDAMAGLTITNLNSDLLTENQAGVATSATPDGVRDFGNSAGPFSTVPTLGNITQNYIIATVERMSRVDYFKSGTTTNIPSSRTYNGSTPAAFFDAGSTVTGNGPIIATAGGLIGIAPGANVNPRVAVTTGGRLEIGNQLGAVTLRALTHNGGGVIAMQLGGVVNGSFDELTVTQDAFISGGVLEVSLISGYTPQAGDAFSLLKATPSATIFGDFADVLLPELQLGLVWDLQRSVSQFAIEVFAADFNLDGIVDASDYTVWRDTLGSQTNLAADADGNGVVGQSDLAIWRQNFGNTRGGAPTMGTPAMGVPASSVPEPAGAVAMLVTLAGLAGQRARRPR